MATKVEGEGFTDRAEFDALREDVARLAKDLSAIAGLLKQGAVDQADGMSEQVRQRFEQAATRTREAGKTAVRNVEKQVEEQPIPSILIAFGAGLLIGKLFELRRN